jgi:miniconductance mechanosensitive channel
MMHELYKYLLQLFRNIPLVSDYAKPLAAFAVILAILIVARLLHFLTKFFVLRVIQKVAKKTKTEWDDIMLRKKVFYGLAHLIPLFFIFSSCFFAAPVLDKPLSELSSEVYSQLRTDYYFELGPVLLKFARIYFIFTVVYVLIAFLNASNEIYQTTTFSHHRSIKGYIQLLRILIIFLSVILVISVLLGKDPTVLLAGLGAMAAVLLLVFKDTILGFVASIQLSANHMVKVGDWIEMRGHHADGTVIDITLNTVKIQNWDKTITTVPTYTLVSESFTNWIGMVEAEGRRIKRSVFIDMYSIRICSPELLKNLGKLDLIREYIKAGAEEIMQTNQPGKASDQIHFNEPGETNIGIFRKYLQLYLKNNPKINQEMDVIVRQLQSSDKGVPLEIVAFSKEKTWENFETVQAEIFDHIFAIIPEFELKVFQSPTGMYFK